MIVYIELDQTRLTVSCCYHHEKLFCKLLHINNSTHRKMYNELSIMSNGCNLLIIVKEAQSPRCISIVRFVNLNKQHSKQSYILFFITLALFEGLSWFDENEP